MRRWAAVFVAAALCLTMSGCQAIAGWAGEWVNRLAADQARLFSSAEETKTAAVLTADELEVYQSAFAGKTPAVYKPMLSEKQGWVYQALLYAVDHGCSCVEVPRFWVEEWENVWSIYDCLALDSPLVDSNARGAQWIAHTYTVRLENPAFAMEYRDQRLAALDRARAVVAAMPDGLTGEREKARYLYEYLIAQCVYRPGDGSPRCYVYEALCEGESVCDGFSNALALLFQAAGITAYEKMLPATAERPDRDDADGHVWVCAFIDGAWYNFDPTFDIGAEGECRIALRPQWFMFPDGDADHTPLFAGDRLTPCVDGEVGAFARDLVVDGDTPVDETVEAALEMTRRQEDAGYVLVRLWADDPAADRVQAVRQAIFERVAQEGFDRMIVHTGGHLVALVFVSAVDGGQPTDALVRQTIERLRRYSADGYGYAVVEFAGADRGEDTLWRLRGALGALDERLTVYGAPVGEDGSWQYWLSRPR
ncbi:MAG: transglutaminase domain-containing protein [Acutalibacteraceae bacterium]|jgi:hypothetical protein